MCKQERVRFDHSTSSAIRIPHRLNFKVKIIVVVDSKQRSISIIQYVWGRQYVYGNIDMRKPQHRPGISFHFLFLFLADIHLKCVFAEEDRTSFQSSMLQKQIKIDYKINRNASETNIKSINIYIRHKSIHIQMER